MLIFKKAFAKNFLSIGKKGVEFNLQSNEKTLIIGANGQGKSTLEDILHFALYGKPFRKINKPKLVNNKNQKNMEVSLTFSVKGHDYYVIRGMKPDKFEIYKDGNLIEQDANIRDYQKRLESIVGMTEKTFRQVVVLGSSSYIPFMRLSAGDRKEVVDNILDVEIYSHMAQVLKARLNAVATQYQDINHQIDVVQNSLEHKSSHYNDLQKEQRQKIEEIEKEQKIQKDKIKELDDKIEKTQSDISSLQDLLNSYPNCDFALQKLSKYKTKIEYNCSQSKNNLSFYEQEYCPTCEQELSPSLVESKKDSLTQQIQEYNNALEKLYEKIEYYQTNAERIRQIQKNIEKNQRDISSWQQEKEHLQRDIDKQEEKKKEIENNETSVTQADLDQLKGELEAYKNQRKEIISNKNHLEKLNDLLKDGGIKQKIIAHYIPIINKYISHFLDVLDFHIQFKFDEEFNESIRANAHEYDYFGLSDGQRLRVDLCILFTWREIAKLRGGIDTNLIIFDEIGSNSLDAEGFEAFMTLMNKVRGNKIIISHTLEDITDKFESVLRVEKNSYGFTEIRKE